MSNWNVQNVVQKNRHIVALLRVRDEQVHEGDVTLGKGLELLHLRLVLHEEGAVAQLRACDCVRCARLKNRI